MAKTGDPGPGLAAELLNRPREGDWATPIGIGPDKGRVVVAFPRPITWFALDPLNAAQVGRELINQAVALGADVQILIPRKQMTEVQRGVLIQRFLVVLRGQLERGVKLPEIARQLVDIMAAEVA